MRRFVPLLLLLLAACATRSVATPTPRPMPTVPLVGEVLANPAPGPIRVIGYLLLAPTGATLIDGLRLDGPGAPAPLDEQGLWLGPAPPLSADTPLTMVGDTRYIIVEATGQLEGPGKFGPAGSYAYRLATSDVAPLSPRDLTIPLLLDNSALYEGQPVRLRAELLTSPDTALLVERLGRGGVPDATARQVKLAAPPRDQAVTTSLYQSPNGIVSFGPVEITGLWRSGRLYPLATQSLAPAPSS